MMKAIILKSNEYLKNSKTILLLIILVAIIARIYITFFTSLPHIHQDSADYFKQADALINGDYINYFPNGYPIIIAITKLLTGSHAQGVLLWLNIIFAAGTIYFVYNISKELFHQSKLALFTALVLALFPTQINLSRWLTSEIPFTFFLTAGYLLYIRNKNLGAGLCFGMATLVRTEMMFIVVLIIVYELLVRFRFLIILLAGFAIPLGITASYCHAKKGEYAISGHGKVNIMFSITASGSNIDWQYNDKHPEIKTEKQALNAYLEHIKNEPAQFINERLHNLWELWGMPSDADGTRSMSSRILIAIGNFILVVFGIAGWWKEKENHYAFTILFPFIIITGLHVMLYALQRYTFPAEPFMILLACSSIYFYCRDKMKHIYSQ